MEALGEVVTAFVAVIELSGVGGGLTRFWHAVDQPRKLVCEGFDGLGGVQARAQLAPEGSPGRSCFLDGRLGAHAEDLGRPVVAFVRLALHPFAAADAVARRLAGIVRATRTRKVLVALGVEETRAWLAKFSGLSKSGDNGYKVVIAPHS